MPKNKLVDTEHETHAEFQAMMSPAYPWSCHNIHSIILSVSWLSVSCTGIGFLPFILLCLYVLY